MSKLSVPILEMAKANHLAWRDKVKDYFLGLNNIEPEFIDHTQCKLGQWLYSNELGPTKDIPTFNELVEVHKTMHDTVPAILEAKKQRNIKLYESEFRTFSTLADLVIAKIELLDMAIQKMEFKDSLGLARRFQEGICSTQENLNELFKNYGQVDRPVHIVSGDMLWSANKDNCHFIVLIDAVGHGPAASMLTTTLATIFSGIYNMTSKPDLLTFKKTVDQFFTNNFSQIIEKENISFDFIMMKIDHEKLKMEILANNHHLAIYQSGEWKQLKLENSADFQTSYIQFAVGEQFAIWTDGLKDLLIDSNKRLGNKGILTFLDDYAGLNSAKLAEHFGKFIDKNLNEFGQLDDILFFIGQF